MTQRTPADSPQSISVWPVAIGLSILLAAAALVLARVSPGSPAAASAPQASSASAMPDPYDMIADAEVAARRMLRDGESARFRDLHIGAKPHMVCGAVNAKNAFGAYGGFQQMIYGAGIVFFEEHTTPDQWREQWRMACQ